MEQAERVCDQIIMLDRGKNIGRFRLTNKNNREAIFSIRLDGDASFIEELSIVDRFSLKEKRPALFH